MMNRSSDRIQLALIAAMALAGLYVIRTLPPDARVATHFDGHGNPNGWSDPVWAMLLIPALAVFNFALQRVLPKIDPRGGNLVRSSGAVATIFTAVAVVLAVVHFIIVATALGTPLPMERLIHLLIGGLFLVMGNVMGKLRTNYTVGIRTPWTLASERVWDHTHRFAGKVFVGGGLLLCALPFLPLDARWKTIGLPVISVACAIAPLVKSYLLWRAQRQSAH